MAQMTEALALECLSQCELGERPALTVNETLQLLHGWLEDHYVIDKLSHLLAEIAVIVNGPEPPLTRWSYHDLPDKVRALKALAHNTK